MIKRSSTTIPLSKQQVTELRRASRSAAPRGWELLLATRIADHILEVGSDPGRQATRIQFKSGLYPDEVSMGGLCRTALASCIFDAIMARTDYGATVTIPNKPLETERTPGAR